MRNSEVSTSITGAAAYLSLGAGYRHNAMRGSDWIALRDAAAELGADESINVVVIRGAGGTFSAGSDIREWAGADPADIDASFLLMEQALSAVERIPIPTVALVEGVAAGAGCQLALSCDLCAMVDTARIGMPVLRLGILPSPEFAWRLTALAGPARARELLYTGRLISAADAERYGLITSVIESGDVGLRLAELVASIATQPRSGLVAAKAATDVALERMRARNSAPGWRFSDPKEFPSRISSFVNDRT